MPMRMDVGFFLLGVVLLLLALTGGRFKPLAVHLSKTIRSDARLIIAVIGIGFLFVALSFSEKRPAEEPSLKTAAPGQQPPGAVPETLPDAPLVLQGGTTATPHPAPRDPPGSLCNREVPVTAAMVTNHAPGTQRKFVDTAEIVGGTASSYAILHNLPDGNQTINTTIRVPPAATEFKVTVGYMRTALCRGLPESIPTMSVAVMGDQSELDRSSATRYKAQPISVSVSGMSEIALVTTAKATTNRMCASVVWSEPRFVAKGGERCR